MTLKNLLHPTNIKIDDYGKNSTKFSFEALERGFGYTLGYALKETMMYTMEGSCITSIRINDGKVTSLEDMIPCKETVADIILNFKDLPVNLNGVDKGIIQFELSSSPERIFSQNADVSEGVEIKKEIFLFSYNGIGNFKIEATVEKGVGYVSTLKNFKDGKFLLDARYSPILFCDFSVTDARVGRRTDLDRLNLDIKTNGNLSPKEALKQTALKIQYQLRNIIDVDDINQRIFVEDSQKDLNPILLKHVEELNLTARSSNCLKAVNIRHIGELVQKNENDLLRAPNFGKKSLNEIKEKLNKLDLSLGTTIDSWSEDLLKIYKSN